jgi:predicted metalloprotease with PDZ domain
MKPLFNRLLTVCLAVFCVMVLGSQASGKNGPLGIEYSIKIGSIQAQVFHIKMEVSNIKDPYLDLSLPTWIPGLYKTEWYAKNIARFRVNDEQGKNVDFQIIEPQRWRVDTRGRSHITVAFNYRATVLAVNQAKITNDFAFFTGAQTFLMAEGYRNNPSTVKFELPEGWKVISALKETADPNVFHADDYDVLIDSPTELGKFDVRKFEIEGKPHYLVVTPPGAWDEGKAGKFIEGMTKIVPVQSAIFGGLPYEKYVYFLFLMKEDWKKDNSLAFNNSSVTFVETENAGSIQQLHYGAAHTIFHVWNLKRIRPAEHATPDYSRMSVTPLWWMFEGFTSYYAEMTILRAGRDTRKEFLHGLEDMITSLQYNDARPFFSPANASMAAWMGYEVSRGFLVNASIQGRVLAALLDLSVRYDTNNKSSLDSVMLALYREFYLKGKGVSTEDLLAVINRLTRRDYRPFFDHHVRGTDVPTYDQFLGYAGYRYEKYAEKVPYIGIRPNVTPAGLQVADVVAGSPAATAGMKAGDIVLTIDEMNVAPGTAGLREWLTPQLGKTINVAIKRGSEEKTLSLKVESRDEERYRISDVPNPTPAQLKLREEWLKVLGNIQP